MALKGIKVIEFAGLAPAPLCGSILADFGCSVVVIDRTPSNIMDVLRNGKRTLALDLSKTKGIDIVRKLCKKSDVLIEPYRFGVMEKLGLGPEVLIKDNPKLVYARLSGFGSKGLYSSRAGHDINYIAISGLLSMFGRKNEKPLAPLNICADFAGGSLMCAFGIVAALFERHGSKKGQIVDCAMTEGSAYVGSWLYRSQGLPMLWGQEKGCNLLDSGSPFYDTYETKDGKFMSVGAIEAKFYSLFINGLGLNEDDVPQFGDPEENRKIFTDIFKSKTQQEWCEIFDKIDACVFPVLNIEEAAKHDHNKARDAFMIDSKNNEQIIPNPAPKLSRTPAKSVSQSSIGMNGATFEDAEIVLKKIGMKSEDIRKLKEENVLGLSEKSKL